MPKYKKNHRANIAFQNASRERSVNHSFNTIELLASELEELDKQFEAHNLGLGITGQWIHTNLSYIAELAVNAGQEKTWLLRLMMTPIQRKEVMLVVQKQSADGDDIIGRSHKKCKNLDDVDGCNILMNAIRKAIIDAALGHLQADVRAIIRGPEKFDIADGYIDDKYVDGIDKNAPPAVIRAKKEKALGYYLNALHYQ